MEFVVYPVESEQRHVRVDIASSILKSVLTLNSSSFPLCFICDCGDLRITDNADAPLTKRLKAIRGEVQDAQRKLTLSVNVVRLGIQITLLEASDISRLHRLRNALAVADIIILQFDDPCVLEGSRTTLADVVRDDQLLLLDVTGVVVPDVSTGATIDARTFVLPPKKLPKGKVALFCRYGGWIQEMRPRGGSGDGPLALRDRFRSLGDHLLCTLRIPLVTGYGLQLLPASQGSDVFDRDTMTDRRLPLSLRSHRDIYALMGTFIGSPRSSYHSEACSLIKKVMTPRASRLSSTISSSVECVSVVEPDAARNRVRQRTVVPKEEQDSGLTFVEDVVAPPLKKPRAGNE